MHPGPSPWVLAAADVSGAGPTGVGCHGRPPQRSSIRDEEIDLPSDRASCESRCLNPGARHALGASHRTSEFQMLQAVRQSRRREGVYVAIWTRFELN
jgi:hypothetical protein